MAAPIIAAMHRRWSAVADFAYVYVEEAHAADEWPLGSVESHPQPKTDAARLALAQHFAREYAVPAHEAAATPPIPVLVDSLDNAFNSAYAVWPERLFVLEPTEAADGDGRVGGARLAYVAEPKDELGFNRHELHEVLARYVEPAGAA